jgi:hypothetical protein
MVNTPTERGRFILDAIRDAAIRLEQAGHGLDDTGRVTDQQFDEVRAVLRESGLTPWESIACGRVKGATFIVGKVFGICLMSGLKEREGVQLTPGLRQLGGTLKMTS